MKRLAASLALCLAAGVAHAELWGHVDGAGVAHFATEQLDSRYSLVLGEQRDALRVPGKADGSASLLTWLDIAPEVKAVQPWLREAARITGVDMELLKALIAVESGFNAKAVSPRGAIGLMQITPQTAERYASKAEAKTPARERLLDARLNILTGARMLADLTRRFGRIDVALAAWNAGEGAVHKHGDAVPPIAETEAHVHMVLELYWALLQRSQRATQLQMHESPSRP
jgi:soluble lytic murein transglycosylase-like protein